jgi:chitodextrinase
MNASKIGLLSLVLLLALCVEADANLDPRSVDASTPTSVTLTWTAPGDDGNEGRAWRYDLRFSTQPVTGTDSLGWWNDSGTSACSGLPDPSEAGSAESFQVTGLIPETTYYFVLRTADEVPNWSCFSNVAEVTTPARRDSMPPIDETPPGPVAGLSASVLSEGINLTWMPSPEADVVGYYVYRSITGDDFESLTSALIGETHYLDTSLLAGMTYYYRVTAVDDSDNESPVSEAVVATASSAAPAVTQLLAPFPAPCVDHVVLRYEVTQLSTSGFLRIFDINGRLVRTLQEGTMEQGQYSVVWNLREDNGRAISPGVYFCVFSARDNIYSEKIVVIK